MKKKKSLRKTFFHKYGVLIIVIVVIAAVLSLLFLNPGRSFLGLGTKITSSQVVEKLRGLSNLTTTKYKMQAVVRSETPGNWWALGQDYKKMLMVAKGTVTAGIDLNQLKPTDVSISADGKNITVNLPPVMILNRNNCLSNNSKDTYVYDASNGWFADTTNQQTELRDTASLELVKAACKGGIMERATTDAVAVIEQFLNKIMPATHAIINGGDIPTVDDCIGE